MGLLPLLLAVSALRFRRGEPRAVWLSWTAVAAVVASFGWFAPGWLVQECYEAAGCSAADCPVGAPFGGLYWLMTLVLPGYASFRYPAKLLVVAALALSVLAARGFDGVTAGPSVRFRRGLLWLGGASLLGAIVALAIRPFWPAWFAAAGPIRSSARSTPPARGATCSSPCCTPPPSADWHGACSGRLGRQLHCRPSRLATRRSSTTATLVQVGWSIAPSLPGRSNAPSYVVKRGGQS